MQSLFHQQLLIIQSARAEKQKWLRITGYPVAIRSGKQQAITQLRHPFDHYFR